MALLNEAPLKRLSLAYWDFSADASDLILLLSVCSTTLEELSLENCSVPDSGTTLPKTIISESSVPPIVCLEALRTVRLQGDFKAFQTSRIETPNLRSLACEYFERPFCSIPSWISDDKVSELRLKVVEVSDILDFGQSICPSSLLIDILKSPEGSFFSVVTWIKRCIEGLPFPNALRKLNIEVRSNQLNEVSNPTRADYELLRRTLQPLHQHGSLQHTNLRIGTLLFNHHTALFDDIATREVEKLRGVFTPLLEANQLTIDVVFERWGQVEEPYISQYADTDAGDSSPTAEIIRNTPCTPCAQQLPIELIHHVVELLAEAERDRHMFLVEPARGRRIPRAWKTCSLLTIRIKVYCVRPLEVFDYPTFEDHQELYRAIEPLHRHGTIERINLQFATENWRFEPIPADKTKEIATMQEVFAPLLEGGQFAVAVEH
ncbi:hypothetical protein EYR40_000572 [Pleurotus pulmonarius]|nr:hypothetical protein EYR40_000572 [Pleurotus pulmonarius]